MEKKKIDKKNYLLKSVESIQNENLKLQHCLKEIVHARKSAAVHLDLVEKQLSSLAEEENQFQTVNAKQVVRMQTLDEEANQLEEEQKALTEAIKRLGWQIQDLKGNSEIEINKYAVEAENVCELFLSTVHNETAESEFLKILRETEKLQTYISEKESDIGDIKKELEEFVFYGIPEEPIELTVPLEERQLLMKYMEDQFSDAAQNLEDLNLLKCRKQMEEMEWVQSYPASL